jgi:hypothetical protein
LKDWLSIWLKKSFQYKFQLNNCRLFKDALNLLAGCSKQTAYQSNENTEQKGVTPRAVISAFGNFRPNGQSVKKFVFCATATTRLLLLQEVSNL